MSTFKAKENISALSLVEEAKTIMDDLESGLAVRKLRKHLCRASRSLSAAWTHAHAGSLANAGIRYASVAYVDVGARAVHCGLRTLRAQALGVGTCAPPQQADQLAKHANSIPISN